MILGVSYSFPSYFSFHSVGEIKDSDAIIRDVVEKCCIDHGSSMAEKRTLLNQVLDLIRQGHTQSIIQNFK